MGVDGLVWVVSHLSGSNPTAIGASSIFFPRSDRDHRCTSILILFYFSGRNLVKMPKFTPRPRKQKHRRQEAAASVDTNVAELAPVSKDEKEARRQKLRDELRNQHSNVSSKKQKRLDKYIVRARPPIDPTTVSNVLRRKTN